MKIAIMLIGAVLIIAVLLVSIPNTQTAQVCFPGVCISAEVADTPTARAQGLMFRETLAEDKGMLFIFDTEARHSFWMKNTYIPLEIIWIDSNLSIVHIEHAVPCTTAECASHIPVQKALYVVEVNAGFVDEYGISVENVITID